MKQLLAAVLMLFFLPLQVFAQVKTDAAPSKASQKQHTVLYGQASYYASKFHGRKTANGEIFDHKKMTAACNTLPLGTWVLITNLRNGKTIKVKIN
ncbi:MAG TPA: septal ring lytic transglycosylase RlpA family protein, partial [Ferruginibacter sp.]|nr:septal ring lytic transglycosylase RlpA family protein [Ferruginibacter sp.]